MAKEAKKKDAARQRVKDKEVEKRRVAQEKEDKAKRVQEERAKALKSAELEQKRVGGPLKTIERQVSANSLLPLTLRARSFGTAPAARRDSCRLAQLVSSGQGEHNTAHKPTLAKA